MSTPATPVGKQAGTHSWKPILAFTLFTLAIGATSYAVFQRHKESIKSEKLHELGSIAEVKKTEIIHWMAVSTPNRNVPFPAK